MALLQTLPGGGMTRAEAVPSRNSDKRRVRQGRSFKGRRSPPRRSVGRSDGIRCSLPVTAISNSCHLTAASRWTTPPSSAGSRLMQRAGKADPPPSAHEQRLLAAERDLCEGQRPLDVCIEQRTVAARPSTSCSRPSATSRRRSGSSARRRRSRAR